MHRLYVDGASRGNPGAASIGASLLKGTQEIGTVSESIGVATNNQAEYLALIAGLKLALTEGITSLEVFADSQLIERQIKKIYKVKNARMKPLYLQAVELINQFESFQINHIPREDNARADELANLALDNLSP